MTFRTTNLTLAAYGLALATAMPVAAEDTVELTNGDTLTGTIVQSDDRGVVLKHPILGTVPLAAERIEKITLDQDLPPDPSKAAKGATPTPPADTATPKPDPDQIRHEAQTVAELHKTDPIHWLLADWNNRLTLGLSGASGNTNRQNYRVKLNSNYEDGRHRWTFDSQWIYAYANGRQSQNQFQTNLTKDWLQKDSPWFFFLKGRYMYDVKRSWENRTSGFGGGGYTLTKSKDLEINTRMGFGGTYEYGSINTFTPEAMFGGSVVKWKITDRAAIEGEATYFPSMEDSTEYRIESTLQWTYKLDMAKGLSLKLGIDNEYDSRMRGEQSNHDRKYYGAVVLSF